MNTVAAGRFAVPIRSRPIGHGVLAPNAKLRSEIIPDGRKNAHDSADAQGDDPLPSVPNRISWARLLKRVFDIDIDLEHCPHCGGELKIIAAIEEPTVIAKILGHLDLPTRAPPRSPAWVFERFKTA